MTDEPIYLEDATAGAYLTQAREALLDCADRSKLYRGWRAREGTSVPERLVAHVTAQSRQLEFARTAILFTALASEAYINGFLVDRLSNADFEAVERLRTPDKYVIGPEIGLRRRLFDRGTEPLQSVIALHRLRHELVHPKGRRVQLQQGSLMDSRFEQLNPQAAALFIVRVAEAATTLFEEAGAKVDTVLREVTRRRDDLLVFGTALREGLPEPPKGYGLGSPTARYAPRQEREARPPRLGRLPRPPDRLRPPRTVPQDVMALYQSIRDEPGTATSPPSPSGTPEDGP